MRQDRRGAGDVLIVLAMTGTIILLLSFLALKLHFKTAGIQPGVTFLGYDLTGLKVNDAITRIGQIVDYVYAEPIYLKYQKSLWMLRYQKHFRLQIDAPSIADAAGKIGDRKTVYERLYDWLTLGYSRQEVPFSPVLDRKFSQTNVAARLTKVLANKVIARPQANGKIRLSQESSGASISAILDALERSFKETPLTDRRVVEVASQEQTGTTTDTDLFDPKYGFTVILQSKVSTVESVDPATFENIVVACQRISGVILNPQDVFSFNKVVGERSLRGGFKEAAGRRVVGIGVGQVSSTMYEPILRVGCKILERHRHSFWYPELKFTTPGFDAAVSDSGWDLRFQNECDLPLLLVASLKGAKLTFEVRSIQEPPFRIDLHTGKVTKVPYRTDWVKDPRVPRGQQRVEVQGLNGTRVRVYRTWFTREEGRKEREEPISNDEYQKRDAVIRVPPAFVPPPEPKEEPPPPPEEKEPVPVKAKPRDVEEDEDEPPPAPGTAAFNRSTPETESDERPKEGLQEPESAGNDESEGDRE